MNRAGALLLAFLPLAAQDPVRPELPASAPAGVLKLDGRLDEPFWKAARVAELVQQSPRPGEPTRYATRIRVLVTNDYLYFGVECDDPEPSRVAIHTQQRDGDLNGDDHLSFALDTYGDRRTGYYFAINAAGARVDGLIANPERASLDWDGIWDARTARTTAGWTAELVIPAKTLNFTPGLSRWGYNVERYVAREQLRLRWSSPTLDSFLVDLSRAGYLSNVEALRQGWGLEVSPYLVGRMLGAFGTGPRSWRLQPGMDMTYRITPQLAAVLTINTDFAETEVDARQLNVTRFPLFFPERRAFFLEGANQYEFGLGLGSNFIPFFSRRVGLFGGEPAPIDAGVKLNGRAGRWNIAFLDVQTRDSRFAPGTNLLASRVSYDLTDRFRVGGIFTNGNPSGRGRNTLAGADAVWRTSRFRGNKNLLFGGWVAGTAGDPRTGSPIGYGAKIDYPNDRWDCQAQFQVFGQALQPALGFLPRPAVRRTNFGCDWRPRPREDGPLGWIRQEFFENQFTFVWNNRGVLESFRYFMAPINIQTQRGDRFEFNWAPQYEFLPVPFEVASGVVLPVGEYSFQRWRLEAETSRHRRVRFGNTTWFGSFYNGTLTEWRDYVNWTSPGGRWLIGLTARNNFGRLRQGSFVQRLWQADFALAWNPNLVLTSFLQYDNESSNLGTNTRLRWTIRPGNDLFVVWNRGWRQLLLSPGDLGLIPETEVIAVKLRWTFRR